MLKEGGGKPLEPMLRGVILEENCSDRLSCFFGEYFEGRVKKERDYFLYFN